MPQISVRNTTPGNSPIPSGWTVGGAAYSGSSAYSAGSATKLVIPGGMAPPITYMLDGKQYPLLADGDFAWNDARTEITFKLKAAAKACSDLRKPSASATHSP